MTLSSVPSPGVIARVAGGLVVGSEGFVGRIGATFGTRLVVMAMGAAVTVLVARVLGPDGRGLYATAAAVTAVVAQCGNFGLHASNTYLVSRRRELLPSLIANSLVACVVFGLVLWAAALLVLRMWPGVSPVNGLLLTIALIGVPVSLAYLLGQGLLLGVVDLRGYNGTEIVVKLVTLLTLVGLWHFQLVTVEGAYAAAVGAGLVGVLLVFWRLFGVTGRVRVAPSLRLALQAGRYGMKAYVAAFLSFLVLRADLLMVEHYLGLESAGYYSVSVAMFDLLYALPMVVGMLLFPKLSGMSDPRARWAVARRAAIQLGAVMLVVIGAAAASAEWLVGLLFGGDFAPAVPPFIWLLPALWLLSVNTVFMNYLAAIGMPLAVVIVPAAGFALNVALNMHLLPAMGTVGASLASVAAYGTMLIGGAGYAVYRSRAEGRVTWPS